jgi:hypothetical protein
MPFLGDVIGLKYHSPNRLGDENIGCAGTHSSRTFCDSVQHGVVAPGRGARGAVVLTAETDRQGYSGRLLDTI